MGKKDFNFTELDIKALIDLFNRFDVEELNLEDNGFKVELKRDLPFEMRPSFSTQPLQQNIIQEPVKQTKAPEKTSDDEKYAKLLSPVVGTCYRAPSPNAAVFVKEGDFVTPETTVCIIEAMKMMNEIKPDVSGKIVQILVENGEAVQVGKVLFLIEDEVK